ncbi:hypothetical protein EST38_g11491 [Candolleomyces aberdarensis]|uniref:Uncharacterized protein n=1 Tax=Candolleomyces aberdarensis TaxID=2316362 RepID=A0A4Q2D4S9_9AGAR|nr:hypothetical protein EST38_g11491 [Candolleomyces aberdarensis]
MLDHIGYNNLLVITEADKTFTSRQQWFQKLAPLLGRAEVREKYNLCLVHRHFNLQPGERMVATGLVTQPEIVPTSDSAPSDIIPSSWTADGIPFEWKRIKTLEEIVAPPPAELVQEFSEVVGEGSVLGLSLAQDPLPEGEIWCEHPNPDLRQHILEIQTVEALSGGGASDTCWKVKISSDGGQAEVIFVNGCKCTNDGHKEHPPPPPASEE